MVHQRTGRTMQFDGLANARDLGGLRRADGALTPHGVFFRSDNVDRLSSGGWDAVQSAGIRTIVDLRRPEERERDTSRRPDRVSTVAVDLDGLENRQFWTDYWDNGLVGTALYYLPYLQAMPDRAVAALSAIVSAPAGGVLFHCMGGRDRTGLIAMLLLAAIDVDATEIVDDYLETVRRGDLRAAAVNGTNDEAGIEALCRRHGTSTTDAFADAVRGLDLERVLTDGGE
ncbi:MAG TPA: tyrosine-protein phosphatase [Jatrophihabitantaceae bacterium]